MSDLEALIIRIGFWGMISIHINRNRQNMKGNCSGPHSKGFTVKKFGFRAEVFRLWTSSPNGPNSKLTEAMGKAQIPTEGAVR